MLDKVIENKSNIQKHKGTFIKPHHSENNDLVFKPSPYL